MYDDVLAMKQQVTSSSDERFARLTCNNTTTYVAHGEQAGGLWSLMARRTGAINFQRNERLTLHPPGDRETLDCTFPTSQDRTDAGLGG